METHLLPSVSERFILQLLQSTTLCSLEFDLNFMFAFVMLHDQVRLRVQLQYIMQKLYLFIYSVYFRKDCKTITSDSKMSHYCKYFLLELLPALITTTFWGRISFVILAPKIYLGKSYFSVVDQSNKQCCEKLQEKVVLWGEVGMTFRISQSH